MIALMTGALSARPCGVHRTFLQPDGSQRADVKPAKIMLGEAGSVRLVRDEEVTTGLGIAEGIETALAIMQRTGWRPLWAAGSAGSIAKLPTLPGIKDIMASGKMLMVTTH